MRRAVLTPVFGVTDPPVRLRPCLVVTIVGIAAQMFPLPAPPPFALTSRCRAISLIGDLQKGTERIAAGEAKAERFHDGVRCRECDGRAQAGKWRLEPACRTNNSSSNC